MIKTSLSIAALVAVAGFSATPALADTLSGSSSFNEDQVLQRLLDRGIQATDVEPWGSKVKATVVTADGGTSFIYLDPDTLRPAGSVGGGTRVLSDLDVGVEREAPRSFQSLTWELATD